MTSNQAHVLVTAVKALKKVSERMLLCVGKW
jgi:hypothetical protein